MPSSNTPYSVAGDLDKITRHPSLAGLGWAAVIPSKPNRVILRFADKAEAQALFDDMVELGLDAFKNWM